MEDRLIESLKNSSLGPSSRSTNDTCTNASGLASDILLSIFFLLRFTQPNPDPQTSDSRTWDWIVLTKICRSWRHVALECPMLWSQIRTIDTCHLDRAHAFLERSAHTDLNVDMEIDCGRADGVLDLFDGHMSRVREFKVAVTGRDSEKLKVRLLEMTQHVRLEILALRYGQSALQVEQDRFWTSDAARYRVLPDDSPFSRSIALPMVDRRYHGLTELSIEEDPYTSGRMAIWQLVKLLEGCPKLQHFKFRSQTYRKPINDYEPQVEQQILALPSLRSISLASMDTNRCTNLLTIFDTSKDVHLDLSIDYMHMTYWWGQLPERVYNGRDECRNLSIAVHETYFTLGSNYALDSNDNIISSELTISIRVYAFLGALQLIYASIALPSDTYWKTAHDVFISFEEARPKIIRDLTSGLWFRLLNYLSCSMIATQSLTIKLPTAHDEVGDCSVELLVALDMLLNPSAQEQGEKLPNLRHLKIHNARFSTSTESDDVDHKMLPIYMESRSRLLGLRCTVSFVNCVFNEDSDIRQTEEYVCEPLC